MAMVLVLAAHLWGVFQLYAVSGVAGTLLSVFSRDPAVHPPLRFRTLLAAFATGLFGVAPLVALLVPVPIIP